MKKLFLVLFCATLFNTTRLILPASKGSFTVTSPQSEKYCTVNGRTVLNPEYISTVGAQTSEIHPEYFNGRRMVYAQTKIRSDEKALAEAWIIHNLEAVVAFWQREAKEKQRKQSV